MDYPKIAKLNSIEKIAGRLSELGVELPLEEKLEADSGPLGKPLELRSGFEVGNRFCILPMEGWDGTETGLPTELTMRRWKQFGLSGAKLIWGGEAVAVRQDGKANPNQLVISDKNLAPIERLRESLVDTHRSQFGNVDDLFVGLQLTHSGRFARPKDKSTLIPRTLYKHPILDEKFGVDPDSAILSDVEIEQLIESYISAASRAAKAGFHFVDLKHCHGYLGHEFLSSFERSGKYGGSFENRTRFLREIVEGIRATANSIELGVRLSIFDFAPFESSVEGQGNGAGDLGAGMPMAGTGYKHAFGGDGSGVGINLDETNRLLDLFESLGIQLVCTTAGSPYYNPHIQRPAIFPPSDGYLPPEDPLVGVARQVNATAQLKQNHPNLIFVGSGYSYLQEWLPNVGQAAIRKGMVDSVGLGRMVLSYPELPADVLRGRAMQRKRVCRTFSDCTTAPRKGLVSGCFPLDAFYKKHSDYGRLQEFKRQK